MKARIALVAVAAGLSLAAGCHSIPAPRPVETATTTDLVAKAQAEIAAHYSKAHPEVQEYVLHTAQTFGRGGLWRPEGAFAAEPAAAREQRTLRLARLLEEGEYGRHLCGALADAGAVKDPRLVPGLLKVAGYHRADSDYDCRPKWMAVAALARQESDEAVPLLISLADHGNQNTRMWARAALSRKTGQDFQGDKPAWAQWWQAQGHAAVDAGLLKPWAPPPKPAP
ncbi:MAG: hypothetical protein FJ221_10035 [Lentisphaerae bacterium]|nr:hypothetical protein [Lentisphaerota bacterium]